MIAAASQGFFHVFNDEVQWVWACKQNACQVIEFFLQDVILCDDHVASRCLGIDDTFFTAEWMVREEVKQYCAVGWFSIEFCLKFSGFRKIDLHIQESDSLFGIGECVFNSGADCIDECHQGVELGVGAQENEENIINETLPKVDQMEESQDYGVFFLAHERLAQGGHPGSHGCTKGLVYMVVHEFEDAMFEDEIEYDGHYMGQWTVCGQQLLVFSMK